MESEEVQEEAPLRVVSLGWYGHSNCGDEAFKEALYTLFPETEFVFISNLKANLDLINDSSYLLVGGGNIISSDFLQGWEEVTIPYSCIGVGLTKASPLQFLLRAEHVLVRDSFSRDLLEASTYTPDLAFSLTPEPELGKKVLKRLPYFDPQRQTVGVFLNDCVSANFDSTILKFIEAEKAKLELSRFLEGLPYNVVFIPMSFAPPDDRRISLDVIGKMSKGYRYTCITEPLEPRDCLSVVSALDYGITMRLHASIFCTICGVPFIDLLHHDKSRGYLETNGLADLGLDYYELSIKSLSEAFAFLERERSLPEALLTIAQQNRRQLSEVLKHVHLPPRR